MSESLASASEEEGWGGVEAGVRAVWRAASCWEKASRMGLVRTLFRMLGWCVAVACMGPVWGLGRAVQGGFWGGERLCARGW